MATFALLHGAMHGPWSWEMVSAQLRSSGHTVITPELPLDDDTAGARDWADVVVSAVDAAADPATVTVVAHSTAGLCLPLVAALRPVRRMVFVAGLVPEPGRAFAEEIAEAGVIKFAAARDESLGPSNYSWPAIRDGFYHDCPESLARWAFDRLRGQSWTALTERCPLKAWPTAVPSTSVVMSDDRVLDVQWSLRVARERIGAEVRTMAGGHSPFLARPGELCAVLTAPWETGMEDVAR